MGAMDDSLERYRLDLEWARRRFSNLLMFEGDLGEVDDFIRAQMFLIFNGASLGALTEDRNVLTSIRDFVAENIPGEHTETVELPQATDGALTQELYGAITSAQETALKRLRERLPVVALGEILRRHHPGLGFDIEDLAGIKIGLGGFLRYEVLQKDVRGHSVLFRIRCEVNMREYTVGPDDFFLFREGRGLRGNYLYDLFGMPDRPRADNIVLGQRSCERLLELAKKDDSPPIFSAWWLRPVFQALRYKLYEALEEKVRIHIQRYREVHGRTPQEVWAEKKNAEPSLAKAFLELRTAVDTLAKDHSGRGVTLDSMSEYVLNGILACHEILSGSDFSANTEMRSREIGKIGVYLDLFDKFLLDWWIDDESKRKEVRDEIRRVQEELSRDSAEEIFTSLSEVLTQPVENLYLDTIRLAKDYASAGNGEAAREQITQIEIYAVFMESMAQTEEERERIRSYTAQQICEVRNMMQDMTQE